MKRVLLVFDEPKEIEFIEANLIENGFDVFKTTSVRGLLNLAKQTMPDLIVINILDPKFDLQLLRKNLKSEGLENTNILLLTELKEYLNSPPTKEYFIVKPIRPKLLLSLIRGVMNNEEVTWLPSMTHL